MSQRTNQWIELDDSLAGRADEAGFLTLGLAQMITTFALWIGLWPEAFGIRHASALSGLLAVLFVAAGALGFYLAFRALTQDGTLPA